MEQAISAIIVLCRDLIFNTKIVATARLIGAPVTIMRDPAKLDTAPDARRLIVDLNPEDGLLDAAAAWKSRSGGEVIGFVSHVDAPTIARARELGLI